MGNILRYVFKKNEYSDIKNDYDKQLKIIKEQESYINALKQLLSNKNIMNDIDNGIDEIKKIRDNKDYEYLIFSGGSTKGVCYIGALKELLKYIIINKIKGFAGTSVGAIFASLLAVGYSVDEIVDIFKDVNMNNFIDEKLNIIGDSIDIIANYGCCPGNYLYELLGDLIYKKTGNKEYTFKQLYNDKKITLVVVGINWNLKKCIYFCQNNELADTPIRLAVRISTGVPFLFYPILFKGDYMIDGGLLDNYPLHVFDGVYPGDPDARLNLSAPNPKVLGLKILSGSEENNYDIISDDNRVECKNVLEYGMGMINIFLAENERRLMTPSYWYRTINIYVPNISLTNFDITLDQKKELIICGSNAVRDFFD